MTLAVKPPERSLRAVPSRWESVPMRERLRFISLLRHLIADHGTSLAGTAASVSSRPLAEKLVSEVLPLADACRWLERNAERVLKPERFGRKERPLWLQGVEFEIMRRPFGIVLVVGPRNYPLFLPAVHALHALVAGNAVRLKPAPGTRHVALAFAQFAYKAGLDPTLLEVLPDTHEATCEAIEEGVDKVVFTGSSENGRAVLAQLAPSNTPSIMELSGQDAMLVLEEADLDLAARALRFGMRMNAGETCIAPRRVIAIESIAEGLKERVRGTHIAIETARDAEEAIAMINASDFALGASIFTRNIEVARAVAARIRTGFVTINDLIVPTADPRMPFGGVKGSGFGTTRAAEGLLQMTFPRVVAIRRSARHRHFDEPNGDDATLFSAYLRFAHGRHRLAAFRDLVRILLGKIKSPSS